jgi:hypothetical protein
MTNDASNCLHRTLASGQMKLPEGSLMAVRDLRLSRRTGRSAACDGGQAVTMFEYDLGADYRNGASMMAKVAIAAAEIQRAMRVMVLGIARYWQFERFRLLTPAIAYYADGHQERQPPWAYAPTVDEFGFFRDFIVTAIPRVAEHRA